MNTAQKREKENRAKGEGVCSLILRLTILTGAFLVVPFSPSFLFPCSPVPLFPVAHARRNDSVLVSTSTRAGRLAVFDDVWETVRGRYYDSNFGGLDWDGLRTSFRKLAADAGSSAEFYDLLRQMLGLLNDPHTRVFAPEEKFDWRHPRFVGIGLRVREVDGLPTVVEVERGSGPERSGVRPGDVIQTVDGEPALTLMQRRFLHPAISSNAVARIRAMAMLLDGALQTYVSLRWQTRDGSEKSARFQREWRRRELGIRLRRERGKYLVVQIDAFTQEIASRFAREFWESERRARGIVLDLRANGGGEAEAMTDIASAFLRAGMSLGEFVDRSGTALEMTTHSKSLLIPGQFTQTKLPLIVLTSERTSSAAEILTAALRAAQRAAVIGSHTCGCVLAIRARHALPDGGALDVSEFDYRTAGGLRLEGQGLEPDELVSIRQSDLYSRRDRALEAALDKLAHAIIPERKFNLR